MTNQSDLPEREGVAPTDYIEAAIHALNSNNPRAALRYLQTGLGPRRYVHLFGSKDGATNTDRFDAAVAKLALEGESDA